MARSRVRINSAGMKRLLNDDGVRDDLTRRAEAVESQAVAGAPVDTGDYQNSIHVVQDTTDRAVVRVVADSANSLVVEFRTGNLAKALDAAGG